MRNLEKEKNWAKQKYSRLEAKLDKEITEKFKIKLKEKNISYAQWLKNKIEEELKK